MHVNREVTSPMRHARWHRRLTAIKSLVAIVVIAILMLTFETSIARYRRAQQAGRDKVALEWSDRVAANLRRYAAGHADRYPPNIAGYWPHIMMKLRPDNDWPVKPPPLIFKTWAGDEGVNIQGYSDAEGYIYQLLFRAAGGTGKVYCRDPKGLVLVSSSLLGTSGPWAGCLSTPNAASIRRVPPKGSAGAIASARQNASPEANDKEAIGLANTVAANLQRYALRHGGLYPANLGGYWPTIMRRLAPDNELPAAPPPAIFKAWAGDEGDYIQGYTDGRGSIYQLLFRAAGGTGKVYCRDPKGMALVAPTLLGKPGPWIGCPSAPNLASLQNPVVNKNGAPVNPAPVPITQGTPPQENDQAAIRVADQVAVNLQHYAARHGSLYPANMSGYWPAIMSRLAPENELPVQPPPAIFKTWAGDEGDGIQVFSDAHGSVYQLLFRAAGGTGKVYCRDPKGVVSVAPGLLGKPGPWVGCPSTADLAATRNPTSSAGTTSTSGIASNPIVQNVRPEENDKIAIALVDKLAANLQRYAANHGGAYPPNIGGYWPGIVTQLAPENDWPVKPPPAIFKTWEGDEGEYIQGYSDASGSMYQLLFRAAGGTGKVYCRDPHGIAPVEASLLGKPGPWDGCP